MNSVIRHELMGMPDWQFPVKLLRRRTDSESHGCAFHWHEQMELYRVYQGGIRLRIGGGEYELRAGDVAVVNGCHPHKSVRFLNDTLHYCVQVDLSILSQGQGGPDALSRSLMQGRLIFAPHIRRDPAVAGALDRVIEECEGRKPGYGLAVRAELYGLFTRLCREYVVDESMGSPGGSLSALRYAGEALAYIAAHYTEPFAVDELARQVGVSAPHLCRIFRRSTGTTLVGYIHELRCHRARLLLSGGCSVTEAAFAVGFADSNYFSRVYRKVFGTSPSRWRRIGGDPDSGDRPEAEGECRG